MKKFYLFFFILSASILNAQDYQNICAPGITFYKNNVGNIKAFRQDSVLLPGNSDTIFISYRTIREFRINNCFDTTNGSVLGRRVYKKHDGTFYFLNWNHDTLTIKSQASLNEVWKFCDLPGGSRIDAQITEISQDTVLGLADEIKVITFQAKDVNGINISHFLNQKTIKLSRHYGIFKTFDLYFTPDIEANDTASYSLNGKTSPHLGIQKLAWKDIYNFDIGDEFHWSGNWQGGPSWQIIKRVLGKEVFGNIDSVKYTMEHCRIWWLPQPPPNTEKSYDTIVDSYDFIHIYNDSLIEWLPETFAGAGNYFYPNIPRFTRNIGFPGRQTQELIYDYYQPNYDTVHCWSYAFEGGGYTLDYTEGLGISYTHYMEIDNQVTQWWENMVYFKKGSETWGTPLASSCSELLPVEETATKVVPDLKVNPNPVETQAEISLKGFKQSGLRYILYNGLGQEIDVREIHSDPFIFNRSGLPGGLYLITIVDDKNSVLARKKMMLK